MDHQTLSVYNANAVSLAARYRATAPLELYRLAAAFFHPGEPTADIGCGSGRDTQWLCEQGFPAIGYDASPAMLEEAHAAYPGLQLSSAALPDLDGIPDESFANVLCSAVIMHVPRADLITAVSNLARITKPGGRLLLSYRASRGNAEREPDGRLFTSIPLGKLTLLLESVGFQLLLSSQQQDASRADVLWFTLVAEKSQMSVARGLERVQSVLAQDAKFATYKFALIRALCRISRTESHLVKWENGKVYVPLWSIAVQWLIFYWPIVNHTIFVAQRHGERPDGPKPIKFRRTLTNLAAQYGRSGLYDILRQIDENPHRFINALQVIAETIRDGPVTYAGTGNRLFEHVRPPKRLNSDIESIFGWVAVPEPVWLDISRFDHWIEDSVVVRWAQLSVEMNSGHEFRLGDFVALLLEPAVAERETAEVRNLLQSAGVPLECVWTGQEITNRFDVDHVVPYAVWGNNDLWNLLPTLPKINRLKSDALPTRALLLRRRDCIIEYWRQYYSKTPHRFAVQVERALGSRVDLSGWEIQAFAGLQENVERLATHRGLRRWEP